MQRQLTKVTFHPKRVQKCQCEFWRHGCNRELQKVECGLAESLHVNPDLPSQRHRQQRPTCQPVTSPQRGADTALSMPQIERRSFFTIRSSLHLLSSVVCLQVAGCVSALSWLPAFIRSVPPVTADSGLSNAPARAGSSIIKRLRRIEIISIRALR